MVEGTVKRPARCREMSSDRYEENNGNDTTIIILKYQLKLNKRDRKQNTKNGPNSCLHLQTSEIFIYLM